MTQRWAQGRYSPCRSISFKSWKRRDGPWDEEKPTHRSPFWLVVTGLWLSINIGNKNNYLIWRSLSYFQDGCCTTNHLCFYWVIEIRFSKVFIVFLDYGLMGKIWLNMFSATPRWIWKRDPCRTDPCTHAPRMMTMMGDFFLWWTLIDHWIWGTSWWGSDPKINSGRLRVS